MDCIRLPLTPPKNFSWNLDYNVWQLLYVGRINRKRCKKCKKDKTYFNQFKDGCEFELNQQTQNMDDDITALLKQYETLSTDNLEDRYFIIGRLWVIEIISYVNETTLVDLDGQKFILMDFLRKFRCEYHFCTSFDKNF